MSGFLNIECLAEHRFTRARVMRITTANGVFDTPVFMPVGTRAGVNNLTPWELTASGSQVILGGNTYHMLCAPGMDVIRDAGGMHPFMGWSGPMLTDSGGFQVFSLSKKQELCTIDEEGAHFRLPNSSKVVHMTPEISLETQKIIGADMIMVFDQCTPDTATKDETAAIMSRTHRWLLQSKRYHEAHPNAVYGYPQALFGIVQGGSFIDLRQESASFINDAKLDGFAIGGESIGFNMPKTVEILYELADFLPKMKPRYTMGVGMSPQDLVEVVEQGIDMFDCVAPTRNARHGALYAGKLIKKGNWFRFESEFPEARLQIKKSCFADDESPIMEGCTCSTCQNYSRAMMHHLCKQKTVVFTALASAHNIHVLHDVCRAMRTRIIEES